MYSSGKDVLSAVKIARTTRVSLDTVRGGSVTAVWGSTRWFAIAMRSLRPPDPKTGKITGGVENIRETVAEPGARALTPEEEGQVLAGFGLSQEIWQQRLGSSYQAVSLTPPVALEELADP